MNQGVEGFTMILSVTMILPVWNSFITFLSQWERGEHKTFYLRLALNHRIRPHAPFLHRLNKRIQSGIRVLSSDA
jgi:hypothetical protein